MGKSKKKKNDVKINDQRKSSEPDFYPALTFGLFALAANTWCWHSVLGIGYAPLLVIFSLILVFTGLVGSGGAHDLHRFNGKNAVIVMAYAMTFATLVLPFARDRILMDKDEATVPEAEQKFAPLSQDAQSNGASAGNVLGNSLSNAFQNALLNQQGAAGKKEPSGADIKRCLEAGRRFFWGVISQNAAVVESESTMELADRVNALEIPQVWKDAAKSLSYESIICKDQSYEDGTLVYTLSAGEGIESQVSFTEGLTWEVSDFQIK